jgi:hypothetical protein
MYLKKVTGINTKMFKKIIFCWLLESHWRKEQDPDLLYSLRIQGSGSVFNPQHKKNNFFPLLCPVQSTGAINTVYLLNRDTNMKITALSWQSGLFCPEWFIIFSAVLLTEDQTRVVRRERVANSNNLGNSWNSETGNWCLSGQLRR